MLEMEYATLKSCADQIPGWQTMNKNDLVNLYIDNEKDNLLREHYFSAIMLRYWSNIFKNYALSKRSGFTIEDCYSWLFFGIDYALRKRKWKDPSNKLYNDPCGPDKVINRCLATQRNYYYQQSNTFKNRINHSTTNFTEFFKEDGVEDKSGLLEGYECESSDDVTNKLDTELLLHSMFANNEYMNGLVTYYILNEDVFFTNNTLNLKKLTTEVMNCSNSKCTTLSVTYGCSEDKLKDTVSKLSNYSFQHANNVIKSTVSSLKDNKFVRNYLCY